MKVLTKTTNRIFRAQKGGARPKKFPAQRIGAPLSRRTGAPTFKFVPAPMNARVILNMKDLVSAPDIFAPYRLWQSSGILRAPHFPTIIHVTHKDMMW